MNKSTIWFKHSLVFENDTATKQLRSGIYDPKNKNVGYKYEYYYTVLICALWHAYYFLPVNKDKSIDYKALAIMLETNEEDVIKFIEALKYCNLLKENKLISASNWLGMKKYSKKELEEHKNDSKKSSTTSIHQSEENEAYDKWFYSLSPEDQKKENDKQTAELEALL